MENNVKEQDAQNYEGELTFWDHLEVLRWALVRIAIVLVVITVFTFMAMPYIFDQYILAPTTSEFFVYQWLEKVSGGILNFSDDFAIQIININVASQFFTHISTSLSFALVLTVPYIIYEIWKFIRPALFDHEVKHVRFAFLGGTVMFYLGCMIAYLLVFPFTFRFLTEYELSAAIQNQIDLSSYIGNFVMLVMVMGIVFEMPLLAWVLSCLGLITKSFLRQYKSYAVVGLMVLSAVITPSGDPFSMMLVMVMGIVFEMPLLAWVLSCLGLITKSFLRQYKSYAVVGLMVLSAVITPSGDPFSMMLVAVPLYLLYEMSILVVKE